MLAHGRHDLGPRNGTLQVRTSREGAYARAGHDLVMDVERWDGVLNVDNGAIALELTCDPRSLRVRWGFNGTSSLTDKDRASISQTIDDKVLRGAAIRFVSTNVRQRGSAVLVVTGNLTIGSTTRTVSFELNVGLEGARVDAVATVTQSEFQIKPYSAMLGTLKVRDEVEVVARVTLPRWTPPPAPAPQAPEPAPAVVAEPGEPAVVAAAAPSDAPPPVASLPPLQFR